MAASEAAAARAVPRVSAEVDAMLSLDALLTALDAARCDDTTPYTPPPATRIVAELASLNESTTCRVFARTAGVPPRAYVSAALRERRRLPLVYAYVLACWRDVRPCVPASALNDDEAEALVELGAAALRVDEPRLAHYLVVEVLGAVSDDSGVAICAGAIRDDRDDSDARLVWPARRRYLHHCTAPYFNASGPSHAVLARACGDDDDDDALGPGLTSATVDAYVRLFAPDRWTYVLWGGNDRWAHWMTQPVATALVCAPVTHECFVRFVHFDDDAGETVAAGSGFLPPTRQPGAVTMDVKAAVNVLLTALGANAQALARTVCTCGAFRETTAAGAAVAERHISRWFRDNDASVVGWALRVVPTTVTALMDVLPLELVFQLVLPMRRVTFTSTECGARATPIWMCPALGTLVDTEAGAAAPAPALRAILLRIASLRHDDDATYRLRIASRLITAFMPLHTTTLLEIVLDVVPDALPTGIPGSWYVGQPSKTAECVAVLVAAYVRRYGREPGGYVSAYTATTDVAAALLAAGRVPIAAVPRLACAILACSTDDDAGGGGGNDAEDEATMARGATPCTWTRAETGRRLLAAGLSADAIIEGIENEHTLAELVDELALVPTGVRAVARLWLLVPSAAAAAGVPLGQAHVVEAMRHASTLDAIERRAGVHHCTRMWLARLTAVVESATARVSVATLADDDWAAVLANELVPLMTLPANALAHEALLTALDVLSWSLYGHNVRSLVIDEDGATFARATQS